MNDATRQPFGPHLRQAREHAGLSLQQLADSTKISARVLDALERNDVSKLPGGIFSRSFVRTYAKEVGLDPEATVARFIEAFPPGGDEEERPSTHTVDEVDFESSRRTMVTLLQVLGLCAVVLVAFLVYRSLRPSPVPGSAGASPSVPASQAVAPVVPATPPPEPAQPGDSGDAQPSPAAVGGEDIVPAGAAGEPGAPAVPARPAGQSAGGEATPLAATPELPIALSVLADEECWLSLSVDGQKVVSRNLQAGERLQFRARTRVTLSAGNAGGLALTINGKPARPLGGRGEVVHTTITLDSLAQLVQ